MRIVGIILISIIPVFIGLELRKGMKTRLNIMEQYFEFVIFAKEQIRYFGREVDEIFALVKNQKNFTQRYFMPLFSFSKKRCFGKKEKEYLKELGLKAENIELIATFVEGLGLNDTEGQINHCGYYTDKITAQIDKLYNDFRQKSKLYISLSVAAALTLFILMI